MALFCSFKKTIASQVEKGVFAFSVLFVIVMLLVPVVLAETGSTPTKKQDTQKKEVPLSTKAKKEDPPVSTREEKVEKVRLHWLTMYERIQKALLQEENLIKRIESRIAKLKNEGKDTTQTERTITEAKMKLDTVKKDLATLDKKAMELDKAADQRHHIRVMMQDVKRIKASIMGVHKLLQTTIPVLKGMDPKAGLLEATKSAKPLPTGGKTR